jgi:hypothetical protein
MLILKISLLHSRNKIISKNIDQGDYFTLDTCNYNVNSSLKK